MRNIPLISIIVPIYNVEQYIHQCIDSIINQTYTNIEIILVDDGSNDSCSEICDQYQLNDARIHVIHKTNGGLSDARNKGIEIALGQYLTFIDSDDYISNDYIECLYNSIQNYGADISIIRMHPTNTRYCNKRELLPQEILYDNLAALKEMMYNNNFSNSACGKLFKSELFDETRFPVGKLYEDVFTIFSVINDAKKIIYCSQICYYYYSRPGSIMRSSFSIKQLDLIEAFEELINTIVKSHNLNKPFSTLAVCGIVGLIKTYPSKELFRSAWAMLKEYRLDALLDYESPLRIKFYALLSFTGFYITRLVMHNYSSNRK